MVRFAGLISVVSLLAVDPAAADEIRHTTFPGPLVGSWAQSADNCAKGDKSNFTIAAFGYGGPDGNCAVVVIVETAGAKGPNYSVRALCAAGDRVQPAGHVVNMIMRLDGADHVLIGTSFENLKPYQRCPAK
ncbi:MAG TPA: hypothetical protein VMA30_16185 [Xanthobacteraceae bacterium]|nr:hypothetical protein [Xanthobacteraceae bacterium]